jgi:hypothetical protein
MAFFEEQNIIGVRMRAKESGPGKDTQLDRIS